MSEHGGRNREKIVKELLESPEIKYVSTSDPNLLKKFKGNSKLRDFTSTDKKLGTNHVNHIHVTVNTTETVKIKAQNGKIYMVPKDETAALVKDGGVILK